MASHTLAYLCALDRKTDPLVEPAHRHTERLGRVERDVAELKQALAARSPGSSGILPN